METSHDPAERLRKQVQLLASLDARGPIKISYADAQAIVERVVALEADKREQAETILEFQREECARVGVPMPSERPVVDKLRELMAKSTSGPWAPSAYEDNFGTGRMLCGDHGRGFYVCHVYVDVTAKTVKTETHRRKERLANLELIAAAVNHLPALLDRVAALEAALRDLVEQADKAEAAETQAEFIHALRNAPALWKAARALLKDAP